MKPKEREALLEVLKARFGKNMHRHAGIAWSDVRTRLDANPDTLRSLRDMEATGGEPDFDTKTSSWIASPPDLRALGGALFCDRRYGRVFVYHNGAQSYYAARGFRPSVRV